MSPHRAPARGCSIRGDHHRGRSHATARSRHNAVGDPGRGRSLVQLDSRGEHLAAQRTDEPRRLDGRALPEEHTAPKHRRGDARRELALVERDRFCRRAELFGRADGVVDRRILRRRRRDHQHPALAQPDLRSEPPDGADDSLAGPRQLQRAGVSQRRAKAGDARPVTVQEAAVAAARAGPAAVGLEHDDTCGRLALSQRERGPETREAAADHAHFCREVVLQRRRTRLRAVLLGLGEPPRRQRRLHGRGQPTAKPSARARARSSGA